MDAPARICHIEEVQIWPTKETAKIRVHIGGYARANIYETGAFLRATSCAVDICVADLPCIARAVDNIVQALMKMHPSQKIIHYQRYSQLLV